MSSDPSQPDLAWRAYCGWAMLPSFLVCGLLTIVLLMSSWFFDEARGIVQKIGSLAVFAIVWAMWIVQLFRWFYRGATYVYRLTPQHLYLDRGFLYNPEPPVDLTAITRVEWGADLLGRYTGVGWIKVTVANRESETLTGLRRPAAFAEEIESAVSKSKNGPTKHLPSE